VCVKILGLYLDWSEDKRKPSRRERCSLTEARTSTALRRAAPTVATTRIGRVLQRENSPRARKKGEKGFLPIKEK